VASGAVTDQIYHARMELFAEVGDGMKG